MPVLRHAGRDNHQRSVQNERGHGMPARKAESILNDKGIQGWAFTLEGPFQVFVHVGSG